MTDSQVCAAGEARRPAPSAAGGRRLRRERRTVEVMLRIYCTDVHRTRGALCGDCVDLAAYADARLDKCPFRDDKPSCRQCSVHCYLPDRRVAIQEVMRHAGPKMLLRHPWLALTHLWQEKRSSQAEPAEATRRPASTSGEA